MNLYLFISKRIRKGDQGSFSATVSRIASITVALGTAVIILSFAVLEGFKKEIRNKIFSLGGHIQVTMADNKESFEENPFSTNTNLYKNWKEMENVQHLQSYFHKAGLLQTKEEVMGVIMKGIGADYDKSRLESNLKEGEFFDLKQNKPIRDIIISKKISSNLKLKVGDSVLMYFVQTPPRFRKLKVRGIYETGLEEFDEQTVFGDIKLIRQLNNLPDSLVGGYEIFIKDFENMEDGYNEVDNMSEYYMRADRITEKYPQIFDWLGFLDRNVLVLLIIVFIVAVFIITSGIFIMIVERTSMIGILKAMGATGGQIKGIFLYNGLIIIVKGLALGNIIGLGCCYIQEATHLFPLNPETYYMDFVPISIEWDIIFALNLLTFAVISLVLFIPLLVISYIRPVKSIRFS